MKRVATVVLIAGVVVALSAIGKQYYESHETSSTTTSTSTTSSSTTTSSTTPPTSSTTSTTTAAAAACAANAFVGSVNIGQGAAGTIYATVAFTNAGAACTVDGWPTVTLLAGGGASLGAKVTQSGSFFANVGGVPALPAPVTVAAQGTVQFALAFSDVPTGSQSNCPTAATVTVGFPGQTSSSATTSVAGGRSLAPCGQPPTIWVSPLYS